MERRQNNIYLFKQWITVIIMGIIIFFLLSRLFRQGDYWAMVFVIGASGVMFFSVFSLGNTQINRLLQANSPQPLIGYYEKRFGRGSPNPYTEALLIFSKALAYTLYGYFDSAQTEVDKFKWEQKPPIFQAQKVYLQTLWAYLEKHDFRQGSSLAKEARRLAEVSSAFPGASISLSSFDTIIEVGELLSGKSDSNIVTILSEKQNRLPILVRVFVVWGLERFYNDLGDIEQAREMRELLTKLAPHCKGLSMN